MNIDDMTDEDLALLTDEERAGLEDDDDDGDDSNEGGDTDGDDDGEDDGDDDAGGDDGAKDDTATVVSPAKDDDAAAPGRDDGEDDDDDDSAARPPAPKGERVDPTAAQASLAEIDKQRAELADQLDDGELTTKEYTAALDKLNEQKHELSSRLAKQQEHDEAILQGWYSDVDKFLAKHTDISVNQTRLQSFDTVVRRVTDDVENAGLSNRQQLDKAHALWREEMGIGQQAAPKDETKTGKTAKTPTPKPALPPTLHNVPAAEIEVGDDGKYSYLDGLLNAGKHIEYEDAMAKLSEADQQDYLSRA